MIDINLIRNELDLVKKNCKNRNYDEKIVDKIYSLDKKWRELKLKDDELRSIRNKISEEINQAKKQKKPIDILLKKVKSVLDELNINEQEETKLRIELDILLATLPNIQNPECPIGDEEKNKEIKKIGKILKIKNPKSHLELGEKLDIIDMKRATKIAGAGFYILKGKGAKLQRALIQFMLDFHEKNG